MAPIAVTPRMDAYRREQAALGGRIAASAAEIVARGLNPDDPDRGWTSLLARLIELIRGGRSLSEELAMDFYRYLRELEDAAGEPPDQPDIGFPTDAVAASMLYTGPRLAKSLARRGDDHQLSRRVGVMVGRSAMRHALNGGRDMMHGALEADPAGMAWARVTDADPCDFCRMLADRGPVYLDSRRASGKTADAKSVKAGKAKVGDPYHDGCACTVIAIFRGPNDPLPMRKPLKRQSASRRGGDGLTARQRAVTARVRQEVHGS